MMIHRRDLLAGLVAGFVLSEGEGVRAQPVDQFYATHPLTIVVGTPPGGAYDSYARLIGRHISRYIPGAPAIEVKNMAGAGGLLPANYLYNTAPKDGSVIGNFSRSIPMQPIFDTQGARFEALKFNWLGSPTNEVSVAFAWHAKPFKTVQDLIDREMVIGATSAAADSSVFAFVLNNIVHTKLKVVLGYPGATDYFLAIERGELDGSAATSWSNITGPKADWLRDKKIVPILQLGVKGRSDIDAPLITTIPTNEIDRRVLELIFSRQTMAYPFTAPPGVPAARVQILRAAFAAVLKDSKLLEEAANESLEIHPVDGDEIFATLKSAYEAPKDVIERARAAILPSGTSMAPRAP